MNRIFAYSNDGFKLAAAVTDPDIPDDHQKAIVRDLLKLAEWPYQHFIPIPRNKVVKGVGSFQDGIQAYELRPHVPGKNQYRLPFVTQAREEFLILGFFSRKDASFSKELGTAQQRYLDIKKGFATYEPIDLEEFIKQEEQDDEN